MANRKKAAASESARRIKKKRRRTSRKFFVTFMLSVIVILGILFTPVFNIGEIEVSGNSKLTVQRIIQSSEVNFSDNIFMARTKRATANIKKLSYINDVKVKRVLPDKIKINIIECIPTAYLSTGINYLAIDLNGKILESMSDTNEYRLPVISGIRLENCNIGEKVKTPDTQQYKEILETINALKSNEFYDNVDLIYYSDSGVTLSINKEVTVYLGGTDKLNSKISMVKESIKEIPIGTKGILNAQSEGKIYYSKAEE